MLLLLLLIGTLFLCFLFIHLSALSQQPIPESLSVVPPTRVESATRAPIPSQLDDVVSPVQPKTRVPVLEQNMANQLSEEEQKALNSKLQEATDADNKVCGYPFNYWIYKNYYVSLHFSSMMLYYLFLHHLKFYMLKVEFNH